MCQQLTEFFEWFENQHGFRKNKSTGSLILNMVVGDIHGSLQCKGATALKLFELSKTFDCVSHDLLLMQLKAYGIEGYVFRMLESYLKNRKQFVSFNGCTSKLLDFSGLGFGPAFISAHDQYQ